MNTEFDNFDEAASAVLTFLQERYGFAVWMVTRLRHYDWIVLHAADRGFGIEAGDSFSWSDAFCSRMVRDDGPRIARSSVDVPAHVEASIRSRFTINAYIGVPLRTACGRFIGTLCAIDDIEHPEIDESDLPLLELLSGLLVGYIRNEIESNELERRNERFHFEAMTDALTHLPNRRAWDEKIFKEQRRSSRLGDTTFVSIIDLNELKAVDIDGHAHAQGEELLRKAALALRYSVRNSDFLARVGANEFAVLGIQCDSIDPDDVSGRIRTSLEGAGINASVGTAVGRPSGTNQEVWENANAAVYADKRTGRRAGRRSEIASR